jgi:hypothetical protein
MGEMVPKPKWGVRKVLPWGKEFERRQHAIPEVPRKINSTFHFFLAHHS